MQSHRYSLSLDRRLKDAIWNHMLTHPRGHERLGFLFTRVISTPTHQVLTPVEWLPLHDADLELGSGEALEMTQEAQARVIKHGHDLNAALVEFHSHPWDMPAQFSGYDMHGFSEFVPYIRWRLKDRPYGAIVVSRSGFDSLIWDTEPDAPTAIDPLVVEGAILRPTGLTLRYRRRKYGTEI